MANVYQSFTVGFKVPTLAEAQRVADRLANITGTQPWTWEYTGSERHPESCTQWTPPRNLGAERWTRAEMYIQGYRDGVIHGY